MTKFRWKESMKMFQNHMDPEKEEQLKWITREMDTKVKKILELIKRKNYGNKEADLKTQSEVIQLMEDVHKQYQSLYALYGDLKEILKTKCEEEEEKQGGRASFSSSAESDSCFYSPTSGSTTPFHENSDNLLTFLEDTSEIVKEALSVEPVSSSGEYRNLEKTSSMKIKELEDMVIELKLEIEALNHKNEEKFKIKEHEVQGLCSGVDLEVTFKEKENQVLKKLEEFRKKSEDSIGVMNQRIHTAEQLNIKNLEKYGKTKNKYEAACENIKVTTNILSNMLTESETFVVRFVECCGHLMNRISKAYCEIKYAQEWVKRKNGDITQVMEDFDSIIVTLGDKEEEIVGARQKVWKLEKKVGELEKILKENEEDMMVLKEEKREAIRQLCVWIDYHRDRSDFLKKALSEVLLRNKTSA